MHTRDNGNAERPASHDSLGFRLLCPSNGSMPANSHCQRRNGSGLVLARDQIIAVKTRRSIIIDPPHPRSRRIGDEWVSEAVYRYRLP